MIVPKPRTEKQLTTEISNRIEKIVKISSLIKSDIERIRYYSFPISCLKSEILWLEQDVNQLRNI